MSVTKTGYSGLTGFLNIDKPSGMTSHDVINRVRRITKIKQVGHAGTLDPMATGVMVVALGKACRLLRFLADDKSYLATITLGINTDTDDFQGKVIAENSAAINSPAERNTVEAALKDFLGAIEQIPPYFSAIHVDGKRLYELARSGQAPPEIKARPVVIHSLELVSYEAPIVVIRVHCSKGTYIRSIARDLGQKLGLGGTLSGLIRETSGRFSLENSSKLDDLLAQPELAAARLVPVEDGVLLPVVSVDADGARRLCMGQKVNADDLHIEVPKTKTESEPADEIESEEQGERNSDTFLLTFNAANGKPFCISRLGQNEATAETFTKYLAPEVVFADA